MKAKPNVTTTATPAIRPVIVESNEEEEAAAWSCASTKAHKRAGTKREIHIRLMLVNE
jgi:hypothetical protein